MATGPETAGATATPADLTAAYLERLRRRVRWQAEAAGRHGRLRALDGGLGAGYDPARVVSWRAGLAELHDQAR